MKQQKKILTEGKVRGNSDSKRKKHNKFTKITKNNEK